MDGLPGIIEMVGSTSAACDLQSDDERCDDCVEVCDHSDD